MSNDHNGLDLGISCITANQVQPWRSKAGVSWAWALLTHRRVQSIYWSTAPLQWRMRSRWAHFVWRRLWCRLVSDSVQRHHITQCTEGTRVRVSSLLLCLYAENRPHCASSIYPLPVTTSPANLFQLSAGQRRGCTLENQFVAGSHIKTNNQCVSPGGSPGQLTHETPWKSQSKNLRQGVQAKAENLLAVSGQCLPLNHHVGLQFDQ